MEPWGEMTIVAIAVTVIEVTLTLKRLAKSGETENDVRSTSLRWDRERETSSRSRVHGGCQPTRSVYVWTAVHPEFGCSYHSIAAGVELELVTGRQLGHRSRCCGCMLQAQWKRKRFARWFRTRAATPSPRKSSSNHGRVTRPAQSTVDCSQYI